MMDTSDVWWPDMLLNHHEEVVQGSGDFGQKHRRMGQYFPPEDHLYTMKQTRERVIWACACGRTLSRRKFE
jgi:hypothetical protein